MLVYVAGTLSPEQWDDTMVMDIVERGMPVLFLPHATQKELKLPDNDDYFFISNTLAAGAVVNRTMPIPNLPTVTSFTACTDRLRSRLRHFPATYEFFTDHP